MKFKALRDRARFTQKEVAKRLGLSHTSVSMWESGASLPRADMLPKIAKLYSCTVDELLRESALDTETGEEVER